MVHTSTQSAGTFSQNKRFSLTRQTEVQPSPIVHFYWLTECILPQLDIQIDQKLQNNLELLISQTKWTPYDPDREEIWTKINNQLN
jgi:hypothetical protein